MHLPRLQFSACHLCHLLLLCRHLLLQTTFFHAHFLLLPVFSLSVFIRHLSRTQNIQHLAHDTHELVIVVMQNSNNRTKLSKVISRFLCWRKKRRGKIVSHFRQTAQPCNYVLTSLSFTLIELPFSLFLTSFKLIFKRNIYSFSLFLTLIKEKAHCNKAKQQRGGLHSRWTTFSAATATKHCCHCWQLTERRDKKQQKKKKELRLTKKKCPPPPPRRPLPHQSKQTDQTIHLIQ